MPSQRRRKLDALVAQLQFEHGPRAIRRAEPGERAPRVARIPTTFAELDALLDGGLPRGRITEVTGPATSGKLTLAAKVIASAHSTAMSGAHRERDAVAAWIDTWRTCDADYMHRCGVDLSRLLVARPATLSDALAMALHLVESRSLVVLVVDTLPMQAPLAREPGERRGNEGPLAGALSRLAALLTETQTAVVFLTDPEQFSQALAHAAAVRLNIRRERWLTRGGDVRGYEGQTELVKNRLGRTGTAHIRITFNGTVRGDGL